MNIVARTHGVYSETWIEALLNWAIKSECYNCTTGFILEHGLEGFPQFGKKLLHKIYVVTSNGAQKMSTIFLNKSIQKHHWQQHWFDGGSKTTLLWTSM